MPPAYLIRHPQNTMQKESLNFDQYGWLRMEPL
jgi:hypothetical protein